MKWLAAYLFFLFVVLGCKQQQSPAQFFTFQLPKLNGEIEDFATLRNNDLTVITFFSPECPLSENYTKQINTLYQEFSPKVDFIAVVPGKYYSDRAIDSFRVLYKLQSRLLLDREKKLTDFLGATITPETFVINKNGNIIYSGAIDNWAVDLGQKREVVTEYFLLDAINAALANTEIKTKKTKAVGCFIE